MKASLPTPQLLTMLALAAAAWLFPREARAADENDAPTLILQGRKLHTAGKTNEAEAKWRAALELDPANTVARDYLVKMGRTNFPPPKPVLLPSAPPASLPVTRTNLVRTSKARLKIYEKLDRIRLDNVKFDYQPLNQVLDVIHKDAKYRDPEKTGINIVISATADPAPVIDPLAGLPIADAAAGGEGDIGATAIKIDPALSGVTLRQLLDIITKVADRPIQYSVEDWGVLFSARSTNEPLVLHTRWFKIDPNTLLRNLGDSHLRQPRVTNKTSLDETFQNLRAYLASAGADLQPPKTIVFSDSRGMLMVRAAQQDLDLIEQAVQVLNSFPPQVQIDVKICEVPEELMSAPGLKLRPDTSATNGAGTNSRSLVLNSILTPDQYRNIVRALEQKEGVTFLAAPRVLTPSGRQAQLKTVEVRTIVTGLDLSTNLPPEPGQPPQHPPISEPFELGPAVDVVPFVAADGYAIQLTVIPTIKEFIGYDLDSSHSREIWDVVKPPVASPPSQLDVIPQRSRFQSNFLPSQPRQSYPLPIFRQRQIVSSATVWDGQTLVLYTRSAKFTIPDNHPALKLQMAIFEQIITQFSNVKKVPSKALLVFVTPRIIDPAGNSVHSDEEISARINSVPPQPLPPQQ